MKKHTATKILPTIWMYRGLTINGMKDDYRGTSTWSHPNSSYIIRDGGLFGGLDTMPKGFTDKRHSYLKDAKKAIDSYFDN